MLDSFRQAGNPIYIRWIPAHKGVRGNEAADKATKDAAQTNGIRAGVQMGRISEPKGVISLLHQDIQLAARQTSTEGLPGQYTWRIDRALPGKHTLGLYGSLSTEEASVLIQARTGFCRLNQNLFRSGIHDTPQYDCQQAEETIAHVLMFCERWKEPRLRLRAEVGDRWGDISVLLGGYNKRRDPRERSKLLYEPQNKWKPDMRVVKATIAFLQNTGRLANVHTAYA